MSICVSEGYSKPTTRSSDEVVAGLALPPVALLLSADEEAIAGGVVVALLLRWLPLSETADEVGDWT